MVENGGNVVVNLLAAWTLFLPLGQRFSLDAVIRSMKARKEQTSDELNDRTSPPPANEPFVSLIVLVLILQWSAIYFFNCVHKSGVGWKNGSALHYFLYQDRIVTDLGIWIREHAPQRALWFFTRSTLVVEGLLAFLLLIPVWQTWFRRAAFLLALGLHGGIAATSRLGPFSYVMTMFFVILFGERDFQLVTRWFGREARAKVVVYDADCGICLWLSRLLKRLDPFERLTFVGNHELDKLPAQVDRSILDRTLVVVDAKGRAFKEERAVFEVGRALPFGILGVWWLMVPGLAQLGRALYRRVADNRVRISVWFGLGACGLKAPPTAASETQTSAAPEENETFSSVRENRVSTLRETLVLTFAIMSATQIATDNPFMHQYMRVNRPDWMNAFNSYTRTLQGWGMFAPEPPYEDGRVVVDARTRSGKKLDPFTGQEPNFNPDAPNGWGHDQFWCDYNNRIRFSGHEPNRQHLEEYLRNWHVYENRPNDELVAFDIWWVQDKSPPPGKTRSEALPPEKLLSHGYVRDSGARAWLEKTRVPAAGGVRP
jgi:predicted DCC family thiol-disulfide oxidoreductase YuxK